MDVHSLKNKTLNDVSKLILGALSFVTALAWNSAFQSYFEKNKYLSSYGPWVYAILITLIVIGITIAMKRVNNKINLISSEE